MYRHRTAPGSPTANSSALERSALFPLYRSPVGQSFIIASHEPDRQLQITLDVSFRLTHFTPIA